MRFVESMSGDEGVFVNASGNPGDVFRGDERLVDAPWCCYTGRAGGKLVSVAMFNHPDNPRIATWFTMAKPFAYMSATMRYHENEISIEPGKALRVRYGVALWDGAVKSEEIQATYTRWLSLQTATAGDRRQDP
jgi:hypothetical protein